jgi:Holliday junction resolvase RusA-like endonuclease
MNQSGELLANPMATPGHQVVGPEFAAFLEAIREAETITLKAWGVPIAKKRPRFARRKGKGGVDYMASINEQETEEAQLLHSLKTQWNRPPVDGPLFIELWFGMPIPKSISNKRRLLMLANKIFHTKKPDKDNLEKFVADVGNNFLWLDDSQLVLSVVGKLYAEQPFTLIRTPLS